MARIDRKFLAGLAGEQRQFIKTGEVASPNTVPIAAIRLPAYQPRQFFDEEKLQELARSIEKQGILEPLLVRSLPDGKYELVAGGRRYRAAQMAKLEEVPAVVKVLDDRQALSIAIAENLQREDLNPVEETEGILRLLGLRLDIDFEEVPKLLYRIKNEMEAGARGNVTPNGEAAIAVFEELAISFPSFMRNKLPLLNLPDEILEVLRQGKIAYTKAVAIAKLDDEKQRKALLEEAIAQKLTLSQIKSRIKTLNASGVPEPSRAQRLATLRKNIEKLPEKKQAKFDKLLQQMEALFEGG